MEVCIVELAKDLARFELSERDLLLDIIEDHEEMFAFLCVSGVVVGHCHDCAVVLHDDGGEFKGYMKFLTESDDEVEFLGQGENSAGFCVGGGCGDSCLFDTAVVECACCTVK